MEEVIVGYIVPFVEDEFVRVHDASLANHENVDASYCLLTIDADYVSVQVSGRYGMLLVRKRIHSIDSFLYASGSLEIELFSSKKHVLGHVTHELVMMAVEETCDTLDVVSVLVERYGAAANTWPEADMSIEAWSERPVF